VTALLWRAGARPDDAARLAALVVAGYEGGLMQARVAGSLLPLRQVTDLLAELVDDVLAAAHAEAVTAEHPDAGVAEPGAADAGITTAGIGSDAAADPDDVRLALPDADRAAAAVLLPEAAPLRGPQPARR